MDSPALRDFRAMSVIRQITIIAVVVGLVIGLLLAPIAYEQTASTSTDRIAVVHVEGVLDSNNVRDVGDRLTEAREDPQVKAVVLHVNSPGGVAVDGEELYSHVARTAEEKPVIASVGLQAASAGYLAALPADEIHANPSSMVGSVGAILVRPQTVPPMDEIIETGPQKTDGQTPRGFEYGVEMIGGSFAASVVEHRGDDLAISTQELQHARIYTGIEAAEHGLIDELGDIQGAIEAAADQAGTGDYQIDHMLYDAEVQFLDRAAYTSSVQPEKRMTDIEDIVQTDGTEVVPTYLMLPGTVLIEAEAGSGAAEPTRTDTGGDRDD